MACSCPLQGWRSKVRSPNGGRAIVFNLSDGLAEFPQKVGCGDCDDCRLASASAAATRCVCEASSYDVSSFITLTYRNEDLWMPWAVPSLRNDDVTLFIKRLRKRHSFRYFLCGEYGDKFSRPHYHALLFGFWPPDAVRQGESWTSAYLEKVWGHGLVHVGLVSLASALYCSRYVSKKQIGPVEEWLDREPPFLRQSQSLGREYARKFRSDFVTSNTIALPNEDGSSRLVPVPRTFLKILEKEYPNDFNVLRRVRASAAGRAENPDFYEQWRIENARAEITHARLHLSTREF